MTFLINSRWFMLTIIKEPAQEPAGPEGPAIKIKMQDNSGLEKRAFFDYNANVPPCEYSEEARLTLSVHSMAFANLFSRICRCETTNSAGLIAATRNCPAANIAGYLASSTNTRMASLGSFRVLAYTIIARIQ